MPKVAGSIPDSVIGIFHWYTLSGHAMNLGSTQRVTEMSIRNISWSGKGGRCVGPTTLPSTCAAGLRVWIWNIISTNINYGVSENIWFLHDLDFYILFFESVQSCRYLEMIRRTCWNQYWFCTYGRFIVKKSHLKNPDLAIHFVLTLHRVTTKTLLDFK
jgi:hypothetical protein